MPYARCTRPIVVSPLNMDTSEGAAKRIRHAIESILQSLANDLTLIITMKSLPLDP